MAVVKDYMTGKARIIIHEDCSVKTQKEIDEILERVAEIYEDYYAREALEQERKKREVPKD